MSALAEGIGLGRRFADIVAVETATVTIEAGEIVGLLGANGAGKTTAIRMLLGLLVPTTGTVRHFGERPSRGTRARMGYLPQGLGIYDDLTPAENLAFAAAVYGKGGDAADTLDKDVADTLVRDLPLGLQRRVAFTEAFAHSPDLLVLDEPTSGVGPLARARLWERIHDTTDAGAGALVSTHYMDEAGQCDRLIVLARGRVVAAGNMDDIVGRRRVIEAHAESWPACYAALTAAGLPAALMGRTVRVPNTDQDTVARVLADAAVQADLTTAPATFEEAFVELSRRRTGIPD